MHCTGLLFRTASRYSTSAKLAYSTRCGAVAALVAAARTVEQLLHGARNTCWRTQTDHLQRSLDAATGALGAARLDPLLAGRPSAIVERHAQTALMALLAHYPAQAVPRTPMPTGPRSETGGSILTVGGGRACCSGVTDWATGRS
jgi:hypothetical protein